MCFLRYGVQQTEMFVILGHFSPFYPTNNPKNENFEKMEKNTQRSHHFTLVYHKWHPHDVWLQWYGAQKILFVIFDFFFYSLTSPTTCNYKIKKKKWKNGCRYYHFTPAYDNWKSYDVRFLRNGVQQTIFFAILGHFLSYVKIYSFKLTFLWTKPGF